ncbi:terminase large subunit domain-containing protein [Rhodococcoides fascians]|uniref:terminase large subunit domain-containing protein n=1 Tax=Rhodococcoides fascians TaxID=1828 RepID=UPI001E3F3EEC|nr:terminase family protein [Rhodococcus fascians]
MQARNELSRRIFYEYCANQYSKFYTDDRPYLVDLCNRLQSFMEQNEKRFMVVNMPPRHGKSFTAKNFTEWLFGEDPALKVMTGSYNETLSTTFARQVRNTIEEQSAGGRPVYGDIFPETKVKYGEASASIWSLEGSNQKSYLATSPTGTATGFGANVILIDDIIKNSDEAYNEMVLEKHWDWLTNTMISRTEGADWKIIIIMTRWATNDLAGRVLDSYEDVEHVTYKAVNDDGSMLCDDILNKSDYQLKTKEMNTDIVEANYNQKPIDIKGRLYGDFGLYESLPSGEHKKLNYTDTADKGTDFLCSVDYIEVDGDVYVTDVVMSDESMETTEPAVAASWTQMKCMKPRSRATTVSVGSLAV